MPNNSGRHKGKINHSRQKRNTSSKTATTTLTLVACNFDANWRWSKKIGEYVHHNSQQTINRNASPKNSQCTQTTVNCGDRRIQKSFGKNTGTVAVDICFLYDGDYCCCSRLCTVSCVYLGSCQRAQWKNATTTLPQSPCSQQWSSSPPVPESGSSAADSCLDGLVWLGLDLCGHCPVLDNAEQINK